jgi:hypothetical protein
MKKVLILCKQCGAEVRVEVFEDGEAMRKGLPSQPVRCERCGSGRVEVRD